jgi:hypothetical protein
MSVMDIGEVPMPMDHRHVPMGVDVRLTGRVIVAVDMLVVLVMDVAVFVFCRLVRVLMRVPLRQVQI